MRFRYALLAVALSACASTSAGDPADAVHNNDGTSLPAEVTVKFGESVAIGAANLRVSFDSVAGDSRCPATVQCVWAGSAIVRLTTSLISGIASVQQFQLATEAGKDTITTYGKPLKLVRVEPAKTTTSPIDVAAYRVVLRVGSEK